MINFGFSARRPGAEPIHGGHIHEDVRESLARAADEGGQAGKGGRVS